MRLSSVTWRIVCTIYSERCHQIVSDSRWMNEKNIAVKHSNWPAKSGTQSSESCHTMSMVRSAGKEEKKSKPNYFQETMQLAGLLQDSKGEMLGHNGLGVLAMCQGNSAEARKNFEQSVVLGKNSGLFERLVNPRTNLAELHHCMGNFKKSFDLVNEGISECREIGYRNGLGVYLRYRVMLLTDLGRFVEADETASFAIQILQDLDHKTEEFATMVNLLRP